MSDLEDRLAALIREVVTPTLKPRGYTKRRLEWMRRVDGAVHTVSLQRSHGNSPDHLRFYVEISAYLPEFARVIGASVPDDPAKGTPQYQQRFEQVCEWPGQWIDLEAWTDADLARAFGVALVSLDEHLAQITGPQQLVEQLSANSSGLDLDLFAWWCATGDTTRMTHQVATAAERFGQEERWPRLHAQFEHVAGRFGITLG